VILRNVGYPPPPLPLLLSTIIVDTGLVMVGIGGAGFNGTDTNSCTADEVVASNTGWLICSLSVLALFSWDPATTGGAEGAGLTGVRETCGCSLLTNGLMLNPL